MSGQPENNLCLLFEEVLFSQGSFRRVRRYYEGFHPELPNAVLMTNGWNGDGHETRQEICIIRPIKTFEVKESRER